MEEKLIYLIAGEPSGDLLASRLMKALREKTDGKVRFAGVGGETMAEQGFESTDPIAIRSHSWIRLCASIRMS